LFGIRPWFIKFYAPWCSHCQKLAPIWTQFHSDYKDKVNVAKVDCTDEASKPLCKRYQIEGYPTLIFFPATEEDNGKHFTFRGIRNKNSLEKFVFDQEYKTASEEVL